MHTPEAMTTRNVADALAKCPLLYAPGQGWQYGSSADVLGAVIEAASGKRFGEFLQEEIFEPLGMKGYGVLGTGGKAGPAGGSIPD